MKKRSGKKSSGGGIAAGIVLIIACIAGLIFAGNISSSVLRVILSIGIGAVLAVIVIMALIILLARKSSKETPVNTVPDGKALLTPEQARSLETAHSQLVNARMIISRFQDPALCREGTKACESMEKVLNTLKEKPEKIQTSRQLFNYYVPTLEKVVTRYQQLENSKVMQEDLPAKLNSYFTDVQEAMANLYEGLFDNDKLNMAVDIEAMTIAIKRDGLLEEEDFSTDIGGGMAAAVMPDIKE